MDHKRLRALLENVRRGKVSVAEAARRLSPFEDLGYAVLDTGREVRCGMPETIFGSGKTPAQLRGLVGKLAQAGQDVLVTRLAPAAAAQVREDFPRAVYHEAARLLTLRVGPAPRPKGLVGVVSAGTSDLPVAEEAAVTAEFFGCRVRRMDDAGVAGLHRILRHRETLERARVLVVVAGMEGALPSVVKGLVRVPVVAVPTSTGYGAAYEGVAALLGMLSSCAAGVGVVNIDNGFGAGVLAALINLRST